MKNLRKIKCVVWLVLLVFGSLAVVPSEALADNEQWWAGGYQIGTNTTVAPAPQSNEAPSENKNSCSAADPVYLHSGEFFYQCDDLFIPGRARLPEGRGLDVEIKHMYRSGRNFNGPFGFGWALNYYYRLRPLSGGGVVILNGNGRKDEYLFQNGQYVPPAGFYETLVQETNGTWTLTKARGEQMIFDVNGNLSAIRDRNGNQITFAYDPQGSLPIIGTPLFGQNSNRVVIGFDYRLTQIVDTVGRPINLFYNADGRLERITDFAGRTVSYTYDAVTDDLLTATKPATPQYPPGLTKTFTYTDHNLETIPDPKNQTFVRNYYNSADKVYRQDLGPGNFQFDYSVPNRTTVTDRNANVVRYDFNTNGNVTSKEEVTRGLRPNDPTSFVTTYTYNTNMEMTNVTFPRGNGIRYRYDETNANTRSRGNLLEVRRKADMQQPDNNTNDIVITLTYEAQFNQIKTITDARLNTTTLTYDYEMPNGHILYGTKGNLVVVQYPAVTGGVPAHYFLPNQYGQVTLTADPNAVLTQYDYHPTTGYLQRIIQDPAGSNAVTAFTYDQFGFPDQVTDAENHMTDYDFNGLGWLIQETNPLGFRTKYTYDKNANLEKVERQANASATQWQAVNLTYTVLNQLRTVTDPLNRLTTLNYDNNQNLISVLDAENHTTDYEYDERNLLFKGRDANTPVRGVTQQDYDINGNLKKIIDAGTHPTDYSYDL